MCEDKDQPSSAGEFNKEGGGGSLPVIQPKSNDAGSGENKPEGKKKAHDCSTCPCGGRCASRRPGGPS